MYYGSPSAFIGWGAFQHNHNWANRSAMANNKAYARMTATTNTPTWQDVNRINYFTPRFAGLQIGVGYAPKMNIAAPNGGQVSPPVRATSPASAATTTPPTSSNCPTTDYAWQDAVRRRRQLPEQVRRLHRRSVRRVRLCVVRAGLLSRSQVAPT